MSGTRARLGKLFPALTAKERAILVLKAWKEDGEEDPLVRDTMPAEQGVEFNRLIDLMNAVNRELGPYLALLHALVGRLGLRHGWLMSLKTMGNPGREPGCIHLPTHKGAGDGERTPSPCRGGPG